MPQTFMRNEFIRRQDTQIVFSFLILSRHYSIESQRQPNYRREKRDTASFYRGQLNRHRLQIDAGPLPCDLIKSLVPSGMANCVGNDGPYRTDPKGLHVHATSTHEHLQLYVHTGGGLKRRIVDTTPVSKRNIDHVNVVSRLTRIHATPVYFTSRFQLIKHQFSANKKSV